MTKYRTNGGTKIEVKVSLADSTSDVKTGDQDLAILFPATGQSWTMSETALDRRIVKAEDETPMERSTFDDICTRLGIPSEDRLYGQQETVGETVDAGAESELNRDELKVAAKKLGIKVTKSMTAEDIQAAIDAKSEEEEEE